MFNSSFLTVALEGVFKNSKFIQVLGTLARCQTSCLKLRKKKTKVQQIKKNLRLCSQVCLGTLEDLRIISHTKYVTKQMFDTAQVTMLLLRLVWFISTPGYICNWRQCSANINNWKCHPVWSTPFSDAWFVFRGKKREERNLFYYFGTNPIASTCKFLNRELDS